MNWSDLLAVALLALSALGVCLPMPAPGTPEKAYALLGEVTIKGAPDSSCPPQIALNTLEGFLTAYNAGDQKALTTYFPPDTDSLGSNGFRWFSNEGVEGQEPKFVAMDPTTLLAYFAARHEQGEAMRITRLDVYRPATGAISFNYTLHRAAADLGDTGVTHEGKGAIRCANKTFLAWSMEKGVPTGTAPGAELR